MKIKLQAVREKLRDERSRNILFVSHCLLNENARYLGGAFAGGLHPALPDLLARTDCGIVQLPCPEQRAWGGVCKPLIWLPLGAGVGPRASLLRLLFPFFVARTHWIYARLAAEAVRLIVDYSTSGFTLAGIVGVDGSPTCGVSSTLGLKASFEYHLGLAPVTLNRSDYNSGLYAKCAEKGEGLFVRLLRRKLEKKDIRPRLVSVSLPDEMKGITNKLTLES